MDDIVKSCYELLNTFVEDYLETLQLILEEKDDLELIEHAVASVRCFMIRLYNDLIFFSFKFESFCEIREEAPNPHRKYQFFVHRFTALCYYSNKKNRKKYVEKFLYRNFEKRFPM